MDKKNDNIAKKMYIKILIVLFSVSAVVAIGGRIVKQILRGYGYVFHSWLNVTYLVAWVLMIGLILIIPFTFKRMAWRYYYTVCLICCIYLGNYWIQ